MPCTEPVGRSLSGTGLGLAQGAKPVFEGPREVCVAPSERVEGGFGSGALSGLVVRLPQSLGVSLRSDAVRNTSSESADGSGAGSKVGARSRTSVSAIATGVAPYSPVGPRVGTSECESVPLQYPSRGGRRTRVGWVDDQGSWPDDEGVLS